MTNLSEPTEPRRFKCEKPYVVNGELRRCRKVTCESCRYQKRMWMMGRLAAEMYTANATRFVTLTYSDDELANGVSTNHVKEYYHNRRRRYGVKHFTVLEHGEKTGRPHFHAIQCYYGDPPKDPLGVACDNFGWAKGTSQYETIRSTAGAIGYLFGYLDKGGEAMRPSPMMGRQYLLGFARHRARNRVRLTNQKDGITFYIPGVRTKEGKLWNYQVPISDPVAQMMVDAYLEEFRSLWAADPDDPLTYFEDIDSRSVLLPHECPDLHDFA